MVYLAPRNGNSKNLEGRRPVRRNRPWSFQHVKKGQMVTRIIGGEETRLRVTRVERGLIHCGALTFEQKLGLEVDPVLGPDMWGPFDRNFVPSLPQCAEELFTCSRPPGTCSRSSSSLLT